MTLTDKQYDEMVDAAKPLMTWIRKNGHPHCVVTVDTAFVELLEGVAIRRPKEEDVS
jgi:hypothetical protein